MRTLGSELATTILSHYPTAAAFRSVSVKKLARLVYDGRHQVGEELACALIEAATQSVGAHHGEPYRLQVRYACEGVPDDFIEGVRDRFLTTKFAARRASDDSHDDLEGIIQAGEYQNASEAIRDACASAKATGRCAQAEGFARAYQDGPRRARTG